MLALAVSLATLLVAGRYLWSLVDSLRARRFAIATLSVAGIAVILLLFCAVVIVWFAYAVAHTGKDARTDLILLLSTIPPFFIASIGLWLLGGKLRSRLRPSNKQAAAETRDQQCLPERGCRGQR